MGAGKCIVWLPDGGICSPDELTLEDESGVVYDGLIVASLDLLKACERAVPHLRRCLRLLRHELIEGPEDSDVLDEMLVAIAKAKAKNEQSEQEV